MAGGKKNHLETPYCSEIWSKMGIYRRRYNISIHQSQNLDIFLLELKRFHRVILLLYDNIYSTLVARGKNFYFDTPYCSKIWSKTGIY